MAAPRSYTLDELGGIISGLAKLMVALQGLGNPEALGKATRQRRTAQAVRQQMVDSEETETTPTQSAQVAQIESTLENLTSQVNTIRTDHDALAGVVMEVAGSVQQHETRLSTVESRLTSVKDSVEASALAVARAHTRIDGLARKFNWVAAGITAAIGFILWLFWFLPTDFGGTVFGPNGQSTNMSVPSQLDTVWGAIFGLLVVVALAVAAGWLFSSHGGSNLVSAGSAAVASASSKVRPATSTPSAPAPSAPVPPVDPSASAVAAASAATTS